MMPILSLNFQVHAVTFITSIYNVHYQSHDFLIFHLNLSLYNLLSNVTVTFNMSNLNTHGWNLE